MTPTKTYTVEELHRLDPSQLIRHDSHRPMMVIEVIRHLIDGDWPAKPTTQKPEKASQSEQSK
jgi:hypothetical protein